MNYNKVKLLVPQIVKNEVKRHVQNEITKVGQKINSAKSSIKEMYWVNHVEELDKFQNQVSLVKQNLAELVSEFEKNNEKYINEANEKLERLFKHPNVILVVENSEMVESVQRRKIYKRCPFHIEDKDSYADALIIETILGIEKVLELEEHDKIYFISRNSADFSKTAKGEGADIIHPEIEEDLKNIGIHSSFIYSRFYTKTLITEFENEIKEAQIYEEMIQELEEIRNSEIEEWYEELNDQQRGFGGLSSLSSDVFLEQIKYSTEIEEFLENINSLLDELKDKYEEYIEKYEEFEEELNSVDKNDIRQKIISYNICSPFLQIKLDKGLQCDEVSAVIDFINKNFGSLESIYNVRDRIKVIEEFEMGTNLSFTDLNLNEYKLIVDGYLNPSNDEYDYINLELFKNVDKIAVGGIEIYYGYMNFDDEGCAADGAMESIDYNIERVSEELKYIICSIQEDIEENINKLEKLAEVLDISIL